MKQFKIGIALLLISSSGFCQLTDSVINSSVKNTTSGAETKVLSMHPYRVNYWVSGSIFVVGVGASALAINRITNKPEITDTEISTLNTNYFTGFDRSALEQDPSKRVHYDHVSDNVLGAIILLPLTLAFDKDIRKNGIDLLFMYAETQAVVYTIYTYSFLGPTFQNKFRPIVYYDSVDLVTRKDGNNRNSFYSGHVATAAAATFLMTKVYCDFHPDLGAKKYLLYAAATIPPLALSYFRVKALKHFPSDNLVGLGLGAVCGIAIPALHKIKSDRTSLGIFTTQEGGMGLSVLWNVSGRTGT